MVATKYLCLQVYTPSQPNLEEAFKYYNRNISSRQGLCTFQYGIISDTLATWEQPFRFSSIMAFFISWISFFNSSISCFASLFFSLICFWLSSMISFISKIHWFGRSSTVWYMPSETYKKQNYPEYWNTSFIRLIVH